MDGIVQIQVRRKYGLGYLAQIIKHAMWKSPESRSVMSWLALGMRWPSRVLNLLNFRKLVYLCFDTSCFINSKLRSVNIGHCQYKPRCQKTLRIFSSMSTDFDNVHAIPELLAPVYPSVLSLQKCGRILIAVIYTSFGGEFTPRGLCNMLRNTEEHGNMFWSIA